MVLEITPDEMIESLVRVNYGHADLRTQHVFRQSLQVLVELAKMEQREEDDSAVFGAQGCRMVMH